MQTSSIEAPASTVTADSLRHVYCMAHGIPGAAMCGSARNVELGAMGPILGTALPPHLCVVCADLMFTPCPTCKD